MFDEARRNKIEQRSSISAVFGNLNGIPPFLHYIIISRISQQVIDQQITRCVNNLVASNVNDIDDSNEKRNVITDERFISGETICTSAILYTLNS